MSPARTCFRGIRWWRRVVGYSRVYRHGDDGYWVWRVSANRWELVRTPGGWRVKRRINRTLNGQPDARNILGRAVGAQLET